MTYEPARGRTSGFRQVSYTSFQTEQAAQTFDGLGGDCSRGAVLAAFKRAAAPLGIAPRLREVIDLLFSYSQAQDWDSGARPIVWPSNQALMDELGLCRRAVQYLLRAIENAGLATMAESPSGKRYGKRDKSGRILEAYGIDLSPLAARRDEFLLVAAEARRLREERGKLRRRITIDRKAIQQIALAGHEVAPAAADWDAYAVEAEELGRGAARLDQVAELTRRLAQLQTIKTEAEASFRAACETHARQFNNTDDVHSAPEGATECAHIQLQTETSISKKNTCRQTPRLHDGSSAGGEIADNPLHRHCGTVEDIGEDFATYRISPAFIANVFTELGLGRLSSRPAWPDVVDAAYSVRHWLGISDDAWKQSCTTMGREGTAVAIAIIAAKAGEIRSPGGYLRGMIERARAGTLRLGPSVYKVRDSRAR